MQGVDLTTIATTTTWLNVKCDCPWSIILKKLTRILEAGVIVLSNDLGFYC
jgi:hypothetical protein